LIYTTEADTERGGFQLCPAELVRYLARLAAPGRQTVLA
jgi:hypothetical protein